VAVVVSGMGGVGVGHNLMGMAGLRRDEVWNAIVDSEISARQSSEKGYRSDIGLAGKLNIPSTASEIYGRL
jgi:hypothetical protein